MATSHNAVEYEMKPIGMKKLAEWLMYCQSIGWPESSLPELTAIWHKFKDEYGNRREREV